MQAVRACEVQTSAGFETSSLMQTISCVRLAEVRVRDRKS